MLSKKYDLFFKSPLIPQVQPRLTSVISKYSAVGVTDTSGMVFEGLYRTIVFAKSDFQKPEILLMKKYLFAMLFILFSYHAVQAQYYAIALKVSTLGIRMEVNRTFGRHFNSRVGFSYMAYSQEGVGNEDYSYVGNLKLMSGTVLLDWFPFSGSFHVTSGAVINMNSGDAILTPLQSYDVGGRVYTPEMLGNLTAKLTFNRVAPYLGLGFGNPGLWKGFSWTFDIGAIYQGQPNVDLQATGLLEPSAEQEPLIEDNLSWFKLYPVISLGLMFGF